MTKNKLKIIIGKNIEKERHELDMTIDELAAALEVTNTFIVKLENGERGTTALTMYNLAEIFNIKVDDLFACEDFDRSKLRARRVSLHWDELKSKREEIYRLVSDVDEDTYEYIMTCIKNFRVLRKKTIIRNS